MDKKYYSISEASLITGLSIHKLRYVENSIPRFSVHKIRNRRYYSKKNLEVIASKLNLTLNYGQAPSNNKKVRHPALHDNQNALLSKIDSLLEKFKGLM